MEEQWVQLEDEQRETTVEVCFGGETWPQDSNLSVILSTLPFVTSQFDFYGTFVLLNSNVSFLLDLKTLEFAKKTVFLHRSIATKREQDDSLLRN